MGLHHKRARQLRGLIGLLLGISILLAVAVSAILSSFWGRPSEDLGDIGCDDDGSGSCKVGHDFAIATQDAEDVTMRNGRQAATGRSYLQVMSEVQSRHSPSLSIKQRPNATSALLQGGQPPTGDVAITVTSVTCNTPIFAPEGNCPAACPFFAAETGAKRACYFQCVTAAQCGSLNRAHDIPDSEGMFCRGCKVVGCNKCDKGKGDRCATCDVGYSLMPDGSCMSGYWRVWQITFGLVGAVAIYLLGWFLLLATADVSNPDGLKEGLGFRSRLKLRMTKAMAAANGEEGRPLWPLSTNLHAVQVAGPGLTLHMNFQAAMILWSCVMIVTWVIWTYNTHAELLVLGLYPSDTPVQMCAVTLKGKELQTRLLWSKTGYCLVAYLGTFFGSLAYAVYQLRRFQQLDDGTSMTDFAATCTGLPAISGTEKIEDELKEYISKVTNEQVVGVSICWDLGDQADDINDAAEESTVSLEPDPEIQETAEEEGVRAHGKKVFGAIDSLFGFGAAPPAEEATDADHTEMLQNLTTSNSAFVVFETEESRDKAVQASFDAGGICFRGTTLSLRKETCEPDTVLWGNFTVTDAQFLRRVGIGIAVVFAALFLWGSCFYLPFAIYSVSFAKIGEEPGFIHALAFSMLVVAGNQIMYFLCGEIADRCGFRFNDYKEAFYVALYVLACFMNVLVDMGMEFLLGYEAMVSTDVHTADGRLLSDLGSFEAIFESYVMQKALGKRLFDYCFPSTFFIPFLMEPIFSIYVPFMICKLLLRTHPEVRGRGAEKSLNFFTPMDMGRYGDIMLNVMLASLIAFFPPGEFLKLFIAFAVSHVFVYVYDQYRILRCVGRFHFATDFIDRYAQALMAVPCGFIAACTVFKGACLEDGYFCLGGVPLGVSCAAAFTGHMILHLSLLVFVVPKFGRSTHEMAEDTFSEAAASLPCTWFSANAVHCLRSKHIYQHDPPCCFYVMGKEHVIRQNPKIGVFFEEPDKIDDAEYAEDPVVEEGENETPELEQ